MKNKIACAAIAAMFVAMGFMAACSDENKGETISFEKFKCESLAKGADADSMRVIIKDYSGIWECTASGVMPVNIGDKDLTALRDTLQAVALVDIEDNKYRMHYPSELTPYDSKEKKNGLKPKSSLVSELSVVLVNPRVVVFKSYVYSYPEGAAHGMYSNTFINYSISEGKVLTLSDIFKQGYEKELQPMLADQAASEAELLVEPEEVPVSSNFRVTDEGIEFIYGLYSIAPYAAGEVKVKINSYEISDLLTPAGKALLTGN